MKFKMRLKKKRSKGGPIAAVAMGLGGLIAAWGYRRWSRQTGSGAGARPGPGRPQDAEGPSPEQEQLAGKFQSLDADGRAGAIPKALQRDPKNIEQTLHPG